MVVLGVVDARVAFFSERTGVDWNVVFLLLGMMAIVGVLRQTGVFEYLAIWSVKRARGKPFRVMAMLIVITALASALLDNVTTVLLIAPVTLLVCERLALPAAPCGPPRGGLGSRPPRRPLPHRGSLRLQHRRPRHPGRRPAEHPPRQPGRPDLQRLPGPPGPHRRGPRRDPSGAVPHHVPALL